MTNRKLQALLVTLGLIILGVFLYKPIGIRYYIWQYKQATKWSDYTKLSDFGEAIIEPIEEELKNLESEEYKGAFRQLAFQSLLKLRYNNLAKKKGTSFGDSVRTARLPLNQKMMNVMTEAYKQETDSSLLVKMSGNIWDVDYEFYYSLASEMISLEDKSLGYFIFIPSVHEPEKNTQQLNYWRKTVASALREKLSNGLNSQEDIANEYRIYFNYSAVINVLLQSDFGQSWEVIVDFILKTKEGRNQFLDGLVFKRLMNEAKKQDKLTEVTESILKQAKKYDFEKEVLEELTELKLLNELIDEL